MKSRTYSCPTSDRVRPISSMCGPFPPSLTESSCRPRVGGESGVERPSASLRSHSANEGWSQDWNPSLCRHLDPVGAREEAVQYQGLEHGRAPDCLAHIGLCPSPAGRPHSHLFPGCLSLLHGASENDSGSQPALVGSAAASKHH